MNVRRGVTAVRRVLMLLFAMLLLQRLAGFVGAHPWMMQHEPPEEAVRLVERGEAAAYDADAELRIDGDRLRITDIVVGEKQLFVMYRYEAAEAGGWSFPETSVRAKDDLGNEYQIAGSGSSGAYWGAAGYILYDKPEGDPASVTLTYEWYDRRDAVTIPLQGGGD